MKTTLKVTGQVEIDIKKDLLPILSDYLLDKHGYRVIKLQRNNDKIVVIVDQTIDEGAKAFGKPEKPKIERDSNGGFQRRWVGFYDAVLDIINEYRAKKKNSIEIDELYEEILNVEDHKGKPKFVKGDDKIEKTRVKQYLSPSQLAKTPQMKGVKFDKATQSIKFS